MTQQIEKYYLATSPTDSGLDRQINAYLEKGYVPYGNPGVTNADSKSFVQIYFQAVVKYSTK